MTPFRHSLGIPLEKKNEEVGSMASFLHEFINRHRDELRRVVQCAREIQQDIDTLNTLIEEMTVKVCPACEEVCCRNRHGYHDYADLVYLSSLGLKPPNYRDGVNDSGLCQFLSPQGCLRKRSVRPFRCTWYFCSPLIHLMEHGSARHSRELSRRLQEVIDLRREMLEEFSRIAASKVASGNPNLFNIP